MSPRISAVITTFNRASIVTDAIKSVAAQTVPVLELIVIDDGSSDETQESVLKVFQEISIPCRYIHKNNGGMASSLNQGVLEAKGDWIAFLDDDDLWHEEHIERCLAIIAQFPELGCVSGLRDENGALQSVPPSLMTSYQSSTQDKSLLIKNCQPLVLPFFTPVVGTSIIKKDLFGKINFEADAGARLDIHFFWRLSELTHLGLDLRSHGIARQYRTSFLSTDNDAPQSIKDEIVLKRSQDEIKMLRLLLTQLKPEQTQVFKSMYKHALVGRAYILRGLGHYSEALSWLRSCWRECQFSTVFKEAMFSFLRIKPNNFN